MKEDDPRTNEIIRIRFLESIVTDGTVVVKGRHYQVDRESRLLGASMPQRNVLTPKPLEVPPAVDRRKICAYFAEENSIK
jgi:hypothetical protein